MANKTWIDQLQEIVDSAALTVRAQTLSPNDDGSLLWDGFMPRNDVESTELSELVQTDFRPVADRREWNQRGRLIVPERPSSKKLQMIPIEAYFKIDEFEMQKLAERLLGNFDVARREMRVSIQQRSDDIVLADFRRIEVDVMQAWANGQITAKDPQTGRTVTVSYGFDSSRYQTAATAWNDGAVNAYDEFISFLEDSVDKVGPIEGAVMRLATLKEIQKDAPNPFSNQSGIKPTRGQLQERVSDDMGTEIRLVTIENTVDVYDDGGLATTSTKVWPAQKVAVIPAGTNVGTTAFAPVQRAFELAAAEPDAQIDIRGVTVVSETGGNGRELTTEAQVNAFPVPNEQKLNVIDAGV